MKYIVYMPCDQMISYLTLSGSETIDRNQAGMWNSFEDAEKARLNYRVMADESFVKEIDELEFNSITQD